MAQVFTDQHLADVFITETVDATASSILSDEALAFIVSLEREFGKRRKKLLTLRKERQERLNRGEIPDFLPETGHIRTSQWTVAPIPKDLNDRRVEITGPVDRKMIINALNSGANVYMADFEDSTSPTWQNIIQGQINLRDAILGTISYTNADGKQYRVHSSPATLMVRPRGWHLEEKHVLVDCVPVSASLFDFGLFFFHNARTLIEKGSGPYFYLPKIENHLEARLWNDVFNVAQEAMDIPRGTIRATVLIETILAAFEMDEILYELREHSAGLNCGRWDYIFSFIKKFQKHRKYILPDRSEVTMTTHFLRSYSQLLIQTCHRRGIHAMGGMAAQIPIKDHPVENEQALKKVEADKIREVGDGHDGTWVAHPALVQLAKKIFDAHMSTPHQIYRKQCDVQVTKDDLLAVPEGNITEQGLRTNIDVALQYIDAWLQGNGCVPIYHLMEDAATAEISRSQIWQWLHHSGTKLSNGKTVTQSLVSDIMDEERKKLLLKNPKGKIQEAFWLLKSMIDNPEFTDFLPSLAYHELV